MKPLVALFAAGVLIAAPVHSQSQYPKAQIDQAERLNDRCRGGSGDDPATMKACEQRDAAYDRLEKAGWCYGKDGDAGFQRKWQRCARAATPTPAGEDAYVYPFGGMKAGETVNNPFPTVLYLNKKCDLRLFHARDMHAYASYRGVWDIGCWAQTVDGQALIVVPNMPTKTITLNALARAVVQKDGTTMTIKALPTYGR